MKENRKRKLSRRTRLDDVQVILTLPASKLLEVAQEDGGLTTYRCLFCDRMEFLERLVHRPQCPVGAALKVAGFKVA